jgi:hypothetical protein
VLVLVQGHVRVEHRVEPRRGNDAQPVTEDQLADARQTAWCQPQPRRGRRHAVAARHPLEGDAQRLEQFGPGEVDQRQAGAPADEPAQQRGGTSAVVPLAAGGADDGPFEHEPVPVGRHLHGDLGVGGAGVRDVLVPLEPERHREGVADGALGAGRIGGEVGIPGEVTQQRLVRAGHLAAVVGDPVQQGDDALGHRTHVVQRVRAEPHDAVRPAPREVRAGAVPLGHH